MEIEKLLDELIEAAGDAAAYERPKREIDEAEAKVERLKAELIERYLNAKVSASP